MTKRYAVLLDGAFVCKRLHLQLARPPTSAEVLTVCERARSLPEIQIRELLRVFYYDAPPAMGEITNPIDGSVTNLGRTEVHGRAWKLLDELELSANVALRKGEISVRGWRMRPQALTEIARTQRRLAPRDLIPDIEQKGVDLRLGLDIARLSLTRTVDTIVVVTGDSDMIPAFKFARREGLRVVLDHLGGPVKRDLKAHVDVVL